MRRVLAASAMVGRMALFALCLASTVGAPAQAQTADAETPQLAAPVLPAYAADPALRRDADGRLVFAMTLSEPLEHHVFSLGPTDRAVGRLVVDFPELSWRLPLGGAEGLRGGGVRDVRFGLHREGRSRMVFDLDGTPRVVSHGVETGASGRPEFRIVFAVAAPSARDLVTGAVAPPALEIGALAPLAAPFPTKRPRPLIVAIDAGHGGKDPGAVHGGVREKDVTLQFAREFARILGERGRIIAVLTRDSDEFVHLGDRVRRAIAAEADLFISIHADATENNPNASGASVYTLSDVASDRLAAALARRENAADGLAGVEMGAGDAELRSILVDLAKRRTGADSDRLAELVIGSLARKVKVLDQRPHRFAGFRVLKTFDTPSVLVELGFLTNRGDRQRLTNPEWRLRAQRALRDAVKRWAAGDPSGFVDASATQ